MNESAEKEGKRRKAKQMPAQYSIARSKLIWLSADLSFAVKNQKPYVYS